MHSSRMRTARSSSRPGGVLHQAPHPESGIPPEQIPPGPGTPPVDRQTPVNILPCRKLRLRAVRSLNMSGVLGGALYSKLQVEQAQEAQLGPCIGGKGARALCRKWKSGKQLLQAQCHLFRSKLNKSRRGSWGPVQRHAGVRALRRDPLPLL